MVTGVDCVGRRNRSQVSPGSSATPLGPTGVFQEGTVSDLANHKPVSLPQAWVRVAQVPGVVALAPPGT